MPKHSKTTVWGSHKMKNQEMSEIIFDYMRSFNKHLDAFNKHLDNFNRHLDYFITLQKSSLDQGDALITIMHQVIELKERVKRLEAKNGI